MNEHQENVMKKIKEATVKIPKPPEKKVMSEQYGHF